MEKTLHHGAVFQLLVLDDKSTSPPTNTAFHLGRCQLAQPTNFAWCIWMDRLDCSIAKETYGGAKRSDEVIASHHFQLVVSSYDW